MHITEETLSDLTSRVKRAYQPIYRHEVDNSWVIVICSSDSRKLFVCKCYIHFSTPYSFYCVLLHYHMTSALNIHLF
jgi:hypothetical protein